MKEVEFARALSRHKMANFGFTTGLAAVVSCLGSASAFVPYSAGVISSRNDHQWRHPWVSDRILGRCVGTKYQASALNRCG